MNIPLWIEMGLAAASTVVVAVLIALTLLPALLGFAGRRITVGESADVAGVALTSRQW